ncbi:CLUMA_CG018862, isoform A [Clunio marinus]|uniref:CLUMA_CG018862, isoform A n=1 Tax=Clunio marinus TaxID=568069 RepID=A0A1J1IZZ3_9DIPT|nr:CLUMA_CG018862, isoform A [Clunio marinus]
MPYYPAGYEYSDSDDSYYCWDGTNSSPSKYQMDALHKSPNELMQEILLSSLHSNNLEAFKEKLDRDSKLGFNIDEKIDWNWNLLYHACSSGRSQFVEYLINERGACVDLTADSMTPLMVTCSADAKSEEILKIVKLLVNKGASIRISNTFGETALMLASKKGYANVVKYLISLNDSFDAIDNEGKNALFHAIDGQHVDTAKILIENGINLNVINRYGCDARNYALNENLIEIYGLFPPQEYKYQVPGSFLSYNRFEDIIPLKKNLKKNEVPPYFPDIVNLLNGMGLDSFTTKFAQAGISLEEFLTISDEKMKEIGFEFPFERNSIKLGLYNFHKEQWAVNSLYVPNFMEEMSLLDVMMILANILRQIVIIKSQIIYIKQLGSKYDLGDSYKYFNLEYMSELQNNIRQLEKKFKAMNSMSKPLLITKAEKKVKRRYGTLMRAVIIATTSIIFVSAIMASKRIF